ncbi:hypothetical protein KC19_VG280300 [Ceratodon purpureus]|uniref:Uncharacterized protein n=1 Tax=Ceratodon purpureus TaxID=3225 RepID=A0A8T0HUK0_CERPU|nr:hypothetical protein KC19_VG280300 [Ceratodon purpureus]
MCTKIKLLLVGDLDSERVEAAFDWTAGAVVVIRRTVNTTDVRSEWTLTCRIIGGTSVLYGPQIFVVKKHISEFQFDSFVLAMFSCLPRLRLTPLECLTVRSRSGPAEPSLSGLRSGEPRG